MCRAYVVMFIILQSIGLCLNTRTVGTATIYDIKMLCPPAAEVFTPPAVGSAEYCNQHVCVCVCVFVCLSVVIAPELLVRSSPKCMCVLPTAMYRSSSGGVVIRYVFPVLWMTSYLRIS